MRIGIDARFWRESGVGRYIRNLVYELNRLDQKNEYVLFVWKDDYETVKKLYEGERWEVVSTDIHWHSLREQIAYPRFLSRYVVDLMHFPYFSVPVMYTKPFVVTIHDLILHHYPTGKASTLPFFLYWIKYYLYRMIIYIAAKRSRRVITVSEATGDEIMQHLAIPKEKIDVVHEGIDEDLVKGKTVKRVHEPKYFLYVGNQYPHKNMHRFIKAYALFVEENKNAPDLIIVGKKDYFYHRTLRHIDELVLKEKVTMLGEVSDNELRNLYQHAIALVAPSQMEGFDLPTVEAMANSCLVIVSDIPAHREICSDAAIYFDPVDKFDIVDSLKRVAEAKPSDFDDKRRKGLQQVKKFSWKMLAEKTLAVYESCVSI